MGFDLLLDYGLSIMLSVWDFARNILMLCMSDLTDPIVPFSIVVGLRSNNCRIFYCFKAIFNANFSMKCCPFINVVRATRRFDLSAYGLYGYQSRRKLFITLGLDLEERARMRSSVVS